jgi:hypothetical protein
LRKELQSVDENQEGKGRKHSIKTKQKVDKISQIHYQCAFGHIPALSNAPHFCAWRFMNIPL